MKKDEKKPKAKLKIIKEIPDTRTKPKLEPTSQFARSMNDYCNQLQAQIDAIMRL